MSVEVHESGGIISFGIPRALFRLSAPELLDATAGDQRFLVMTPEETPQNDRELTVLLNWRAQVKK